MTNTEWASLADFLEMGGWGLYVWGACSMVGTAAVWEALTLAHRRRRALDELRQRRSAGGADAA